MKFLCIDCDTQMQYDDRQQPGDGTFAASFACPRCHRRMALLANPMETQLVSSLGVRIGGRVLEEQPMELTRSSIAGRPDAFDDTAVEAVPASTRAVWSAEAQARLARVPGFVRGMVKKIYGEYANERGIRVITPEIMDRAREELGLEGM